MNEQRMTADGEVGQGARSHETRQHGASEAAVDVLETLTTCAERSAGMPVGITTALEAAELSLCPKQQKAMVLLSAGRTRGEAAREAGVSRRTIQRWLNSDAAFVTAYNIWMNDMLASASARLMAATHEAVNTVVSAIRQGNAKLAWDLLNKAGVTKRPKVGETNVEDVKREMEMEERKKAAALKSEERIVGMEETREGLGLRENPNGKTRSPNQ